MTATRYVRGAPLVLPNPTGSLAWTAAAALPDGSAICVVGYNDDGSTYPGWYASTRDGGATWDCAALPDAQCSPNSVHSIAASATGFCVVGGNRNAGAGPLYLNGCCTSADGGHTWSARALGDDGSSIMEGVTFCTNGATNRWLAYYQSGSSTDGNGIFTSDNDGATFVARSTYPYYGTFQGGIGFDAATSSVCIPSFGIPDDVVLRSTDLGNTWAVVAQPSYGAGLIFSPTAAQLRMWGGNGAINRYSNDGGATWVDNGGAFPSVDTIAVTPSGLLFVGGNGTDPMRLSVSRDSGHTSDDTSLITAGDRAQAIFQAGATTYWLENRYFRTTLPDSGWHEAALYPVVAEPVPHYVLETGVAVTLNGEATWSYFIPDGVGALQFWGSLAVGRGNFDLVVEPDPGNDYTWLYASPSTGSAVSLDLGSDSFVSGAFITGTVDSYGFEGGTISVELPFWTGFINCMDNGA